MSDAVLTALIMTFGTIICQILINKNNTEKRKKDDLAKETERARKDAEKETRLEDRLASIEAKLDEHNGYAQKFDTIADKFTEVAKDLSAIKTSIDFLKKE